MPKTTASNDLFKKQANRLKIFLKNGGFDIKHTHALEAIAAINGEKDFHTLQHNAERQPGKSSPIYVVNSYGKDEFVNSTVCFDLATAVADFVQNVRIYTDLLPDLPAIVAGVTGGARTAGLYLYIDGRLMVTLLQAGLAERCGNTHQIVPEAESFDDLTDLAYNLSATLAHRKERNWKDRQTKVVHSMAALSLRSEPASEIYKRANPIYSVADIEPIDFDATLKILDSASVSVKLFMTVSEDGSVAL